MTRAEELRKLLLEVEAGEWDVRGLELILATMLGILGKRTGNYIICKEIIAKYWERRTAAEILNQEEKKWHARRLT